MIANNENKLTEIINIYATLTTSVQKNVTAQPILSSKSIICYICCGLFVLFVLSFFVMMSLVGKSCVTYN